MIEEVPAINIEKEDPELHEVLVKWCNNPRVRNKELVYSHGSVYRKVVRSVKRLGPNEPCICGSGKKYKKCCME